MKRLLFVLFSLLISNNIQSQEYTTLLVDSLYYWSCYPYSSYPVCFDTDCSQNCESAQGTWDAYSYDSSDSLIQIRSWGGRRRHNISYLNDTIFQLNELLDLAGNWHMFSRSKKVVENNLTNSELSEMFNNDEWINSPYYVPI